MASIDAQLVELGGIFGEVATFDPISGVLFALGALITLVYAVVGGWLSLGAVVDFLTRGPA